MVLGVPGEDLAAAAAAAAAVSEGDFDVALDVAAVVAAEACRCTSSFSTRPSRPVP